MSRRISRPVALFAVALVWAVIPACKKEAEAQAQVKKVRESLVEVAVEIRSDQLAYRPGASEPFTGDAIQLYPDRVPASVARRTPYLNGRKHGLVVSFTAGGKLREERRFANGTPVSSVVYHGNGRKKIEVLLNERDLNEGPYKRWYDNGVLQSESGYDAQGRLHGVEKNYDITGKLMGHYVKTHGQVTEIVFETAEMKAERLERSSPAHAPPQD